jgi:hypothetical protein
MGTLRQMFFQLMLLGAVYLAIQAFLD